MSDRSFDPLWRFDETEPLLDEALELDGAARAEFLIAIEDPELRHQVESLLALADGSPDSGTQALTPNLEAALHDRGEAREVDLVDQRLGTYRLLRRLGAGGMATVYLARQDDELDRQVAIKVLRHSGLPFEDASASSVRDAERRFRAEGRILANLDHSGIAKVFDSGFDRGHPYLVLEYIDGSSITDYCVAQRLDVKAVVELVIQVCEALHFAHQRLIVHRDLKPSNILVTRDGAPKLLDFGIAKLLEDDPETGALTVTEQRLMTPDYAAPEQIRGEAITTATDVWGIGVVLYELLTGVRPFRAASQSVHGLETAICSQDPARPSRSIQGKSLDSEQALQRRRRQLDGDLDTVVLKALRKRPEHRYQSMEALAQDLRNTLESRPIAARRPTWTYRLSKMVRRNPVISGATVTALALIGALVMALVMQRNEAAAQRDMARAEARRSASVSEFLFSLFGASNPEVNLGQDSSVGELLELGRESAEEIADPLTRAQMLVALGDVYVGLGEEIEAAVMLEDAAASLEQQMDGPLVRETRWEAWTRLAEARLLAGEFDAAEDANQRALAVQELIDDRRSRVLNLETAAMIAAARGDTKTSIETLERALVELEGWSPSDGESDEDADAVEALELTILLNYGSELREAGQHSKAESVLRRSVELSQKVYGESHHQTAQAYTRLGALLVRMERPDEALPSLHRAADIQLRIYGEDHPRYGQAVNVLADAYRRTGRYPESVAEYRTALATYESAYGVDHLGAGIVAGNLCEALTFANELEEAIALCERAVGIAVKSLGEGNRYEATSLRKLGLAYLQAGRVDDAQRTYQRSARVANSVVPRTPTAAFSNSALGAFFAQVGRPAEAIGLLDQALEVVAPQYEDGAAALQTIRFWRRFAGHAMAVGSPEAEQELEEARALLRDLQRQLQPRDPALLRAQAAMAQVEQGGS